MQGSEIKNVTATPASPSSHPEHFMTKNEKIMLTVYKYFMPMWETVLTIPQGAVDHPVHYHPRAHNLGR